MLSSLSLSSTSIRTILVLRNIKHSLECILSATKTAGNTFDKYGKSDTCNKDGRGGGWANNVYLIGKNEKSVKQAVCKLCWNLIVQGLKSLLELDSSGD